MYLQVCTLLLNAAITSDYNTEHRATSYTSESFGPLTVNKDPERKKKCQLNLKCSDRKYQEELLSISADSNDIIDTRKFHE